MKKTHILIALAMLAALSMVSCKNNNKKTQSREPSQEEVQEMKQALADTVLAQIDALADYYWDQSSKTFRIKGLTLTDAEKAVKPDYLLDPSFASTLVSKSQKINALSIYLAELSVRRIYDMPCDQVKEVIAKLAAEVNHPIDTDLLIGDTPTSEKFKKEYEICKERGDVAYFWHFQFANVIEITYIIANNPELFLNRITEEQWQAFRAKIITTRNVVENLAKYDEEMSQLREIWNKNKIYASHDEAEGINSNKETIIKYHIANKDKYIARRNALLQ